MTPFGLHWSGNDQKIMWVSPEDGAHKVVISDTQNWFDLNQTRLITQKLSDGNYLALYPDMADHGALSGRIFDPKTGQLISDELQIVSPPHNYFDWNSVRYSSNEIEAFVSDDGEIRIQYFDTGNQVMLSYVIGSEKAVTIIDKDGNEKLLVDVEQVQFDIKTLTSRTYMTA